MKTQSVLLVDDEELMLSSLERAFRGEPYQVLGAGSAQEALDKLSGNKDVAVVIADEQMPRMLGTQFLGIVARKYPAIRRVVMTGKPQVSEIISGIEAGEIHCFLKKPFDLFKLALTVREQLTLA